LLLAIVGFEVAGVTILIVEEAKPGANILNASDALWWSYVTIATVGYGDRYPVTTAGRITGAVVITLGVALFTTITGFLSEWFRRPRMAVPSTQNTVNDSDDLYAMLSAVRQTLEEQAAADQAALAELHERLERIEQRLNIQ
jgi:voltage-gated potassium channel